MSKKKDETMMNDAKKTEGEKKYAKLPEKVVAGLPAAAILQSNEKVMDLFARGKKRGRLDSGEMMEVLDDLDLDSDQMEKIYDSLEALSIEIGSEEDILPELPDDLEPPIDEIAEIEEEELVDPNTLVDSFSIDDPVRMYLKEIGKVPLLAPDEEIELAQKMSAGNLAKEQLEEAEEGSLSPEDQAELKKLAKAGDAAKQKLAEANLRLVVSLAKHYTGRGIPLLDLIQEGNMGLMHAAEKYDYMKENRFSTYASWWIKEAMQRAIDRQAREIRVPVHVAENMKKVQRAANELRQELGRDASPKEIADRLAGRTEEEVKEILSYFQTPVSLETPIGENGEDSLGDMVENQTETTPEEAMDILVQKEEVKELLETLSEREREVIRLRYGLEDGKAQTLEEIGGQLGVTRERVRQIEARAMEKLRKNAK